MKEFHLATEDGKNAKVGITRAKSDKKIIIQVTNSGEEAENVIIHKGKKEEAEYTSAELIAGDPEIDMEHIGMRLEGGTRAFFKPDCKTIEGGFKIVDVIFAPDGSEKDRKDHITKKSNVNDTFPVKLGKRLPIKQAFQQFVFHNHYALFHDDGLKYDFMYNIAKGLADKKEVALLGAGSKGNAPLVFVDGGSPYRGFLMGEVSGDKYRLLVLLSKQELKKPIREEKPVKITKITEAKPGQDSDKLTEPKGEVLDI